ncbi:hypothetical protein F3Y22_tig00117000pilonHSYRG00328 [Hibiscus syriacus]|uniref:F-box/kelch-repeat protein n=1 Tax=Hibiscus syriacus TaxID=106335 RepID=A0A6A2WQM8_HIBSY|nr:hypothetical protein F3Y22_tig00117000pilonHSYRG00328 [Hibiscus syriacus]
MEMAACFVKSRMPCIAPPRCWTRVPWDLSEQIWKLNIPPNQIVEVDGKLFSSGDCLKPSKAHIDVYDGMQNMWNEVDGSRFQTLNSPVSALGDNNNENWPLMERLHLTMAPIGNHIYFLAGHRMAGESPQTI